jgi:hypothetical protein
VVIDVDRVVVVVALLVLVAAVVVVVVIVVVSVAALQTGSLAPSSLPVILLKNQFPFQREQQCYHHYHPVHVDNHDINEKRCVK